MSKIHVLILGPESSIASLPESPQLSITCTDFYHPAQKESYELAILNRTPSGLEQEKLFGAVKAYTLFYTENADEKRCADLLKSKQAKRLKAGSIPNFLERYGKWFFREPYGEKFRISRLAVSDQFTGHVSWKGNYALELEGDFGSGYHQAAFWRNNIPLEKDQTIDFWLEYKSSPGVELQLQFTLFREGTLDTVCQSRTFSQEELEQVVRITADTRSFLFVSVLVRGSGTLDIISLHDRYSRGPFGYFLPGGERYVTSEREEIFCYFDPGDRKPPLNVYFSGYKTREGFEAYGSMRRMGAPFLLVSEARLEGGAFYIGSPEYEELMEKVLKKYMDILGFSSRELILSGISMGSAGALYYGCSLKPYAVIAGKPLVNMGSIAANERLNRPGGFPTSLDLLRTQTGALDGQAVRQLDERFWRKFRQTDWSETKLIMSYMLEDDYDREAYGLMVQELSRKNARIYGRGLHGRHNDNTIGIVQWFFSQFHMLLNEDFGAYAQSPLRKEIQG